MAPAKSGLAASAASMNVMMMPRCTMSITRTKGLLNMPGQNNCFLNSAVQVLWHLDIFRRSFRDLSGHICMTDSCIFCALKELFAQFQYSQESALPPDALRRALAETFFDQRRFQLGFMDDAAECFENILQRIHFHIASQEVEDMCSVGHCIPHQKFAMTLVEQTVCHICGASSEPLPFTQMVHYVSASALCLQASIVHAKEQKPVSFGELLRKAGGMGDIRDCPSTCGAKIQICKTLMNRPDIVSLGLVWDSERPSVDHIVDVLDSIGMTVNMDEMFHKVVDSRWASTVTHHLVGIVTYYGKHYSTFFFHTKLCVWIYFDDATVREIGPHWQQVVDKCRRGHFQPLLLLYANPNGTPVSTASAPTSVIHYMSEHKRKQTDSKRPVMEKHRYSHQGGKKAEQPGAGGCGDELSWGSRSGYGKKGISMGGRSAMQEPLPVLDMAHGMKPRARTYSDTSIMSERHFEPAGCDGQQQCTDSLRRIVRQGRGDGGLDLNGTYISRQAVESVLSLQHLQRQRALNGTAVVPGSRNSSSSLESFETSLRDKVSDFVDGACRRRDSGNWSGDRNSASSASSTSLDGPYYYTSGGARRACGSPGRVVNNFSKHEYSNIGMLVDKGYDSYSLSSTDSYPSAGMPGSPAKADPRLKQIPEAVHISNMLEKAIHHSLLQGSDSASDSVFDDVFTGSRGEEESQDCDKLCSQAEGCLTMSYEKEQAGDLKMAIFFCDSAAAKARAAMDAPYGNAQSLIAAKMKHSMCVMRSSNLSKKLKEADERRRLKESTGYDNHHSRQGSRDSTHSRQGHRESQHTRQGSRDSACTVIDLSEPVKNIEIYATLPKKSSKKKNSALSSQSSLRFKEDIEVYKDFLSDQWHTSSQDDLAIKMMSDGEYTVTSKPKARNSAGSLSKANGTSARDPEFSDYSSEWEQSKKSSLHRTLSNPTGMKGPETDEAATASASMKKQHRIRRKLMGGFMRRKNRSLPDLREGKDSPQTESRALDDTVIFDSKNERAIKQESSNEDETREDHSATIKRCGFHQPHRAFVSRGHTQRPLLTKVDPPQVEGMTVSSPNSMHQRNTVCGQEDVMREQALSWSQPCQQQPEPFGSKAAGVDAVSFSDTRMQSPALGHSSGSTNVNQSAASEPSGFLKEPQSKRSQILNSLPKAPESARNLSIEASMQVKTEQHCSLMSGESEPSGFLKELQSKRSQILNSLPKAPESARNLSIEDSMQVKTEQHCSLMSGESEPSGFLKKLQSKRSQILNSLPKALESARNLSIEDSMQVKTEQHCSLMSGESEPSGFLKLQSKRSQILNALPKAPESARNLSIEASMQVKTEQHCSLMSGGGSWLCELQSKQMAMLKKGDHVDDTRGAYNKDLSSPGMEEVLRQPLLGASQFPGKFAQSSDSQGHGVQAYSEPVQSPEHCETAEEQIELKPRSVKDLALKFEKILRPAMPDPELSAVREESVLTTAREPHLTTNKSMPNVMENLTGAPRDPGCEPQTMNPPPLGSRVDKAGASSSAKLGVEGTLPSRPINAGHLPPPASAMCHRLNSATCHSQIVTSALQNSLHRGSAVCPASGGYPPVYQAALAPPAAPCNPAHPHAMHARPFVPPSTFQSAPSPMHGATSYDQKPVRMAPVQQHYGRAYQYVKSPDAVEPKSLAGARVPLAAPNETVSHAMQPVSTDSSKRPTRPPDYETALQRLEMIKEKQRTTSPDGFQFPAKTTPDVPRTQQLPQPEAELGKQRRAAPKKCVTFSDEVVLVACAEEEEDDYVPNPLLERVYRQHAAKQDYRECPEPSQLEDISSVHSSDSCDSVCHADAVNDSSQVPCNLCHKKFVSPPTVYCPDCAFYMSRFQKRA